jgi:hypothetical protein
MRQFSATLHPPRRPYDQRSAREYCFGFGGKLTHQFGDSWDVCDATGGTMSLSTSTRITAEIIARFHSSGAGDSWQAMKRVPAPSIKAAAMPRPSKMPPAATTGIGATFEQSYSNALEDRRGREDNV